MENKNAAVNSGSNFATLPGLIILLFFLVLSFYFKTYVISSFLLLFIILCLIALLWGRRVMRILRGDAQFLTGGCFPEDEIRLSLSVYNSGKLSAIWTEVFLPLPEREIVYPENAVMTYAEIEQSGWRGQAVLQKFTWLMPGQRLTATLHFRAKRRGLFIIDRLYLQTGDGFGISMNRKSKVLSQPIAAAVFPKIYPVSLQAFILQGNTTDTGKHGVVEDVTLLKNIRPYAYGDNFKRINWRMLARGQEMQVNVYEQITPESICFLLDLQSFESRRHVQGEAEDVMEVCAEEAPLERALSLIASCVIPLGEQGVSCGLLIPGYKGMNARCSREKSRQLQIEEILLMLAEVDYQGGPTEIPRDMLAQVEMSGSRIYVIRNHISEKSFSDGISAKLRQQARVICMSAGDAADSEFISAEEIFQVSADSEEKS